MSGQIIHLHTHRKHLAPHDLTGAQKLEQHLVRISGLLEELEMLTRNARHVPPRVLAKARVTMEKARRLVGSVGLEEAGEPQPEVDREVLERMYRELKPSP